MMWISVLALVINGGITLGVHRGRRDLNVRAVWIHNLGDALSNVAIFAGALAIRSTGAEWVDPALGIAIGAMVLWSGLGILNESGHILLEGLPRSIRLEEVARRSWAWTEFRKFTMFTSGPSAPICTRFPATFAFPICTWKKARGFSQALRKFWRTTSTLPTPRSSSSAPGLPAQAGLYMPEPVRRSRQ